MYNKKNREYTSPTVETLNVRVERGFAGSGSSNDPLTNPEGNDSYGLGGEIGQRFN